MKKLLALLLSLTLFAGVVPTSAFADTVDIEPAYNAMSGLFVAYSRLGAAVAGKNAVDAAGEYAELFNAVNSVNAYERAQTWSGTFGKQTKSIVKNVGKKGYGLGLEGTWKVWGKNISLAYNRIGEGLVIDTARAERKLGADAINGAEAELAKVEASIAEAVNTMMNSLNS